MKRKSIVSPSYALRPHFVGLLTLRAKELGEASQKHSRLQWSIAKELLTEWQIGDYEGELTKDKFYCEVSRVICDTLGFALVSTTGETVKVWCEVFAQFENTPESIKEQLPFQYFRNARMLCNAGKVAIPMAAITIALDHKLTAEEMLTWFNDPDVILPEILELRQTYPKYLWGALDILVTLNGTRQEAQYHLNEFYRLAKESEQA